MSRERSFWFGRAFDSGTKRRAETERAEASEQPDPAESVPRMGAEALPALSASARQREWNPETQRYDGPVTR